MGVFMNVNCRKCGDGPEGKLSTKNASNWAMKHGKDAHDNPYQGMRYTNSEQRNTKN